MAKKKEEGLTYLQMPLPESTKRGKMTKLDWSGINYRNQKDTGEISKELNISTHSAPYLTPSEKREIAAEGVFDEYLTTNATNTAYKDTPTETEEEILPADIYTFEGRIIVQGHRTRVEETDDGGEEEIRESMYQVYDRSFNLEASSFIDVTEYENRGGTGVLGFRYFEDFENIAKITTGRRLLYFPGAYSQILAETKILKRHFHDAYDEDREPASYDIGRYITGNCTDSDIYYLFECAQDTVRDKYGNVTARYPGGVKASFDGQSNSLTARTNSPRGGHLRTWHFNIQRPYYHAGKACAKPEAEPIRVITGLPKMNYVCTAHQRLFGISDECVYASGFNNYANWTLDTADSYSAENAWMSSTQSTNGEKNTGIISYGASVFVFKENVTLEITNTKNPFRINEVFSCGAIDQKGIQVAGNYLIFVSSDGVKLYNGSSLKDIGYKLNIDRVNEVVTGTDGRRFYMSVIINDSEERRLFVYDTYTGLWAEEDVGTEERTRITSPILTAEQIEDGITQITTVITEEGTKITAASGETLTTEQTNEGIYKITTVASAENSKKIVNKEGFSYYAGKVTTTVTAEGTTIIYDSGEGTTTETTDETLTTEQIESGIIEITKEVSNSGLTTITTITREVLTAEQIEDGIKSITTVTTKDGTETTTATDETLTEKQIGSGITSITTVTTEEGTEKTTVTNGKTATETVTEEIKEEKPVEFVGFAKDDSGFYALSSGGRVYRLDTGNYDHDWGIETDFFTNGSVDIKHINKLQLLSDIDPGSTVRAYILYDDEEFDPDKSHRIFEYTNSTERAIKLPIRVIPRKTANYGFKIRIEGHGFVKLYQMEVLITGGGEKNISG